jgi:phosphoribosylformylglycinamidine cyclo-ligase
MRKVMQKSKIDVPKQYPDIYKDAGVDTNQAETSLWRLTTRIVTTWPDPGKFGGVKLPIGYFANVINLGNMGLAFCTDGVGSKVLIAQMMQKYDTIGIDCVAMNVNDLICVGATPVSIVDYIAVEHADPDLLDAISIGLTEGAKTAGVSICGGEIAQLRDIITGYRAKHGFDLVAAAVGTVPLDRIIVGKHVQPDDVVIGLESNGIHSNGMTLARRAFFDLHKYDVDHQFEELDVPLGAELLKPTYIYVKEILDVLSLVPTVKALTHITSDGLLNLTRVAAADVGYVIDALPPIPPIFAIIQNLGGVEDAEMFQVYNMGVGFCIVVGPEDLDGVLALMREKGRKASRIGYVVSDPEKKVFVKEKNIIGEGKHFRRL